MVRYRHWHRARAVVAGMAMTRSELHLGRGWNQGVGATARARARVGVRACWVPHGSPAATSPSRPTRGPSRYPVLKVRVRVSTRGRGSTYHWG